MSFRNLGIGINYANLNNHTMGPLAGIGITAGLDAIGNFFGNRSRKREARRQRQFDLSMWNSQNAYNTPAMQMKRLKDAGLNPALMYGQGTTGNATSAVTASIPQIQNPLSSSGVASGVQLSLANAQKQLLKSQRIKNLQDAATGKSAKHRIDSLVGLEAQQLATGIKKMNTDIAEALSKIDVNKGLLALQKAQVKNTEANTQVAKETAQKVAADADIQEQLLEVYKNKGVNVWDFATNTIGVKTSDLTTWQSVGAGLIMLQAVPGFGKAANGVGSWILKMATKRKRLGFLKK